MPREGGVNQPGLNFTTPRTRSNCPASSHHAEARLRKSGRLSRQQQIVLNRVVAFPGLMASQIADLIASSSVASVFAHGSDSNYKRIGQVQKRRSDLCHPDVGLVRRHYTPGENESRWFSAGE